MSLFKNVTFHTTVASLNDLPADSVCEIAFAGRSNAGKSSAINTLANHSRLAFVSKMPGRTQHLNYFRLVDGKYLVDLPGYGFAKAPAEIRAQWEGLLAPYLIHRSALAGLVLIMDSRHPMTDLDVQMIDWFAQTGKPIHILLSKADKLTRTEQAQVVRAVREALSALDGRCSVQLFSSLKHTGVAEAEKVLGAWLGLDVTECEAAPPVVSGPPGKVARPRQRKVQGWAARSAGKEKEKEKAAAKNKKPPVA